MEATLPSADTNGSGPQNATFSYFRFNPDVHTIEKPFEVLINLPSMEKGQSMNRRTNQEFEDRRMTVHDARGHESDFTLNQNGFCWRAWKELPDWRGTCAEDLQKMGHKRIQEGYIKAVENFIKAQIEEQDGEDVDFVEVFDYKLRSSSDIEAFYKKDLNLADGLDTLIPVTHPHVDQSFDGAVMRLVAHMGDEAKRLMLRRFRIINVWKPLGIVESWPLALCDSRSVDLRDLVATDTVRRQYVSETFYSLFNADQKWYYLSGQNPEEVTMLKIYDSDKNAAVRFNLHSSFTLQDTDNGSARESFEVRAFVFDKEK